MSGATQFFLSFINTQVKGVEYLNMQEESMLDIQFMFNKIRQSEAVLVLYPFDNPSPEADFHTLLLKNPVYKKEGGPYSVITSFEEPAQNLPEAKRQLLGIKDFLVFNDVTYALSEQTLYYADTGNHVIRKMNTKTGEHGVVAGTYGTAGYNDEVREGPESFLNSPMGIHLAENGDLYISDTGNHRIRKLRADDNQLVAIAGTGESGYDELPGNSALESQLYYPMGLHTDTGGVLYFADMGNHRIRRIYPDGVIETVCGTGNPEFTYESEDSLSANIYSPVDVTIDRNGNIYFTDSYNSRIGMIDAEGKLRTVAGSQERSYRGDDDYAKYAKLRIPTGITHRSNLLYIADSLNQLIRRIEPGQDNELGTDDDIMRTVVGHTGRMFIHPGEDPIDSSDDVYMHISKPQAGFMEGISITGNKPTDVATSHLIRLNNPSGMTFDAEGNLFFADSLNNRIRVLAGKDDPEGLLLPSYDSIRTNYLYTLIENETNNRNENSNFFRSFDYTQFTFQDIGDYSGRTELSALQFSAPIQFNNHPLVSVHLEFLGKDVRTGIYAKSNVQTTVGVRNYDE